MAEFAQRITVVPRDGSGKSQLVFHAREGKRKRSPWLKPYEQIERRLLMAASVYTAELLNRHDRSSRKKRDGWVEDWYKNTAAAEKKGYRVFRKIAPRILPR